MQKLIVDGYNVIYKIPKLRAVLDKSLEKARNTLGSFLLAWKKEAGFHGKIIVAFDGQSENILDQMSSYHGITFLFSSKEEDADCMIISLLKENANSSRAKITVVTDDNYIANHCRVYQAEIRSVAWLSSTESTQKADRSTKGRNASSTQKRISRKNQQEINQYLKGIWGID